MEVAAQDLIKLNKSSKSQPASNVDNIMEDLFGSTGFNKKRCKCCTQCCCVTATVITLLIVAILTLILGLVFGLKDYNQCQRACQMKECKNFSCFLDFKNVKRINQHSCRCSDASKIDRFLAPTDTIQYDKSITSYCVCGESGACETVDYRPAEFLHKGPCGACSNLNDLLKYQETAFTLTKYSTKAAALAIFSEKAAAKMMTGAGFTEQCSACWVGNMQNTLVHCFSKCVFGSRASCDRNGKLTPCLQCDEDRSGLYFRLCAGMTRRRAGIVSDICREDGEIEQN